VIDRQLQVYHCTLLLHDLCGFTELEIAALVQQVGSEGNFAPEQTEQMRQLMRVFYNGYTFHPDATAAIYKAVAQRGLRCGIFASTDARQSSSN